MRPALQLVINGVSNQDIDGLALRTASLDAELELRVKSLEAAGHEGLMYVQIKSDTLEQLFVESSANSGSSTTLESIKQPFITLEIVEGQDEPKASFDSLAYSNELRRLLIARRPISADDLNQLATARADNTRAALIEIDPDLQERISIGENAQIADAADGPVKMKVSLSSNSDPGASKENEK